MDKERNAHQIVRKDGKGCFVESLNDAFSIGRCHLAFAAYDLNRPAGERQTNLVQIYLNCGELLELCRKAESGELLLRLQDKKIRPRYISAWAGPPRKSCAGLAGPARTERACPVFSSYCPESNPISSWWRTADLGKPMRKA